MTPSPFHWQDDAACAGLNPAMFFPEQGGSTREAVAVCNSCPVQDECLKYALDNGEKHGIYGGLTARQRRTLHRLQPRRKRVTTHGTPGGHQWHLQHHEQPCWACADADSRWREGAR